MTNLMQIPRAANWGLTGPMSFPHHHLHLNFRQWLFHDGQFHPSFQMIYTNGNPPSHEFVSLHHFVMYFSMGKVLLFGKLSQPFTIEMFIPAWHMEEKGQNLPSRSKFQL